MRWTLHPKSEWRKWFAWHVVTVYSDRVWLEVVERKYNYDYDMWDYR